MITDVDDYFRLGCGRCARFDTPDCATRLWAEGLAELRAICLASGLRETAKWGHPVYMQGERNVALIGAFRGAFTLGFFNPALMTDPEGVLERQGSNTRHPNVIRFSSAARVAELRPTLAAYLTEAKGYAEQGLMPPKEEAELELPEELLAALDADPELAEAFHALTPGRQKSHAIQIGGAKKSETRTARIEKLRPKILAGKGALDR
ncbi:YdeI/OmpD-associated family protein [Salipiger mangrovisoli]|uniref:YdeI/OmpD-associated family protein n=1 Tax=Salipiger mangrovisoli TaxID=2865933 RepID=A0ABR9X6J4_9RHOB|nr:YdeI/OmpD-associated family protein [Salipiger mangrovisoli]MBE9639071.1 YdeI/OmpD-associated family protein [Salipiger mangrovisoli]